MLEAKTFKNYILQRKKGKSERVVAENYFAAYERRGLPLLNVKTIKHPRNHMNKRERIV